MGDDQDIIDAHDTPLDQDDDSWRDLTDDDVEAIRRAQPVRSRADRRAASPHSGR